MNDENRLRPLHEALDDHSAEGIALLTAEPSRLTMLTIVATAALVLCALLWSFIGHADVIVTAQGTLAPESEVRRFYAPVDGELADLYVAEGQPVSKDDVLARLNARGAIEAAAKALEAQLKLEDSEREWRQFPERKALMERRAAALKQQLEVGTRQHENRMAEGTTRLAEQQRAQLQEARSNLENARRARDFARQEQDRYARLFALPGGGGVSQAQVEAKRASAQEAENGLRVAQSRLAELDARLAREYTQASADLEGSGQDLANLRIQYDAQMREIGSTEDKLRLQVQTARLVAEAAARIKFENIDKDNFLLILAPTSGVITDVTSTQRGDKVQANAPLGGIAPKDARPVLRVEIAERDRAFLREGLPVKLKFSAFPFQRYGLIAGTLEYISPATKPSGPDKQPVYEGRVRLAQDYYTVADQKYPLRYGMTATAEIVVRERRLIDLGLDPFRQVAG
ncbi:HlyD family efflux transporter periplasmic adaptor subunit [Cupriavidus plantarum]|uniref:HlyD family secretion protein n=3 Tax=Cupriavidus plantarum TaxID=942865 RepID=A0A316F3K6_9BURK|nr:HlyD family efflux transporter periplasmic adaptor subunit [Cupriavidus plantarum]NYH98271.1 HlyD family secretion protein [Cupriavidus plantarum]PWK38099.1 HlyD family secretion protein [Cupriavidus plantarum]RLK45989.1 HlyD family secretion protein [Cupriavidus plantarum]CAG2127707.1 Hemolysin secretion protein D, chromosomal [Cupriavidus plantarum]SMR67115.1 HlyD family secretion protein [Cupriavidus plantarum]